MDLIKITTTEQLKKLKPGDKIYWDTQKPFPKDKLSFSENKYDIVYVLANYIDFEYLHVEFRNDSEHKFDLGRKDYSKIIESQLYWLLPG